MSTIGDILLYPMSIYWFHMALGIVRCIFMRYRKNWGWISFLL